MKFRNELIAAGAALAVSALASAALAAGSVSTTAPASVTVLSPVTITKTQNLVFGSVIRPSNAGANTVSIDQNDSISGSGNGSLVTSTVSSAKFDVAGGNGTTFTTTQSLSFTQAGPTNVTATVPIASNGTLGTIPPSGVQELRYGGSFDMHAATTAQAYTGNLSVTVNYN